VKLFVNRAFLDERRTFSLRYTCEYCVHFDPDAQACSFTYPTQPHRQAQHDALQDGDVLMFCKTFEMG
jgi:hypothetical protein